MNAIDIVVGSANVEGSIIPAPLLLNFDINGVNGLDQGSISLSTMYAVYMIADSRYYLPTACIATLSSNVLPLIPKGYDSYRLIGFWGTDPGGLLLLGYYFGLTNDMTFYYAGQELAASLPTGAGDINLASVVPSVNNVQVGLQLTFSSATPGNILNLYNGFNSGSNYVLIYAQVANQIISEQVQLFTGPLVGGTPVVHYNITGAGDSATMYVTYFSVSI
jgi:hypothetical protein